MAKVKKTKICISVASLLFVAYVVIYSEDAIGRVRKDLQEQSQNDLIKQKLHTNAVKLYNLEHYENMQEDVQTFIQDTFFKNGASDRRRADADIETVKDLSVPLKDSILYIVEPDGNWETTKAGVFNLIDTGRDESISKYEFAEFADYIAENQTHRKAVNQLFDTADIDGDDSVTRQEFGDFIESFRKILLQTLKKSDDDDDERRAARARVLRHTKKGLKNGRLVLDTIEQGLQIHNTHKNDASVLQQERARSVRYFGLSKPRWQALADAIFEIVDANKDAQIDENELREVSKHFREANQDEVYQWLRKEAQLIDQNLAEREARGSIVVQRSEYNTVSDRIYTIFVRYNGDTIDVRDDSGDDDEDDDNY